MIPASVVDAAASSFTLSEIQPPPVVIFNPDVYKELMITAHEWRTHDRSKRSGDLRQCQDTRGILGGINTFHVCSVF